MSRHEPSRTASVSLRSIMQRLMWLEVLMLGKFLKGCNEVLSVGTSPQAGVDN